MYVKRNYGFVMTLNWSKKPFIYATIYATICLILFEVLNVNFSLPWQPISIIGIAVAFYLGFKNNSAYDRTWEARKIWGAIVNNSRTFATAVLTLIRNDENQKISDVQSQLIKRHIAWLTALRFQLRLSRTWEHVNERIPGVYVAEICNSYHDQLEKELLKYIPEEEIEEYRQKSNMATQILKKQTEVMQELNMQNKINDYKHVRMHEIIGLLYDDQGKCERIKNFPFPRQYASTALWMTFVFSALIPFGLLSVFEDSSSLHKWLTVPFTGLITWIFFLMEKIGDYSENPFEGTYNDVPITSIARTIEIDLLEMINEVNIPEPMKEMNGFQM